MRKEADYYPKVESWMKRYFLCFKTRINVGTTYSHADVVGVRDTGGENSGEVELIVIEVKAGHERFATASGQAVGYSVYANRVYLADVRKEGFKRAELEIASNLGVGLIQINGNRCTEILSSCLHQPLTRMWFQMVRALNLGQCRICGTFIDTEELKSEQQDIVKSIDDDTGFRYWHEALAERKKKMGISDRKTESRESSFQRRFVCDECVALLFGPLYEQQKELRRTVNSLIAANRKHRTK